MQLLRFIAVLSVSVLVVTAAEPTDPAGPSSGAEMQQDVAPAAHEAGGGDGHAAEGDTAGPPVTPDAPELFRAVGLPVTNSMVYTWIIMGVIFVAVRWGTRRMQRKPQGLQNVIEVAVEALERMTSGLLEPKVSRWAFPLVATFFLFILLSNLAGLLPGVGSIGYGTDLPSGGFHVEKPWFRPPTADANTTVAMAGIFFIMNGWWALRYNGPVGLMKHIFGVKGGMTGAIVIPLSLIFLFIGLIEVISICIRPVALAMRLYGNIYGGESVLTIMLHMPPFGLPALPFYFLELIVAIVQALVFTLLSIAFTGALCSHSEEESHEGH